MIKIMIQTEYEQKKAECEKGGGGMNECRFYINGRCEYFTEARAGSRIFSRRCCMRIVKPVTECFYYQPKDN